MHFQQQIPVAILFICLANLLSTGQSKHGGFRIHLIHRDSPSSPLYNPQETPTSRFRNAFQRGISRAMRFNMISEQSTTGPQFPVSADNGEYLIKFSIGNPPVDIYAIADTGSDLMWTQCLPCQQCYKQTNPVYNPAKSSTYRDISCDPQECNPALGASLSCSAKSLCSYSYGYADNSFTHGALARETITFGSGNAGESVPLQNITFGCGHNNSGVFSEKEMGLVGLGGGPLSLSSQIGSLLGTRKFSYCLVPFHTDPKIASKIYFGNGSEVIGKGVVSTPLVPIDRTLYSVTMEGVSIGDVFLPYNSSTTSAKGTVFIDSGTPPTLLPQDFYNRVEQVMKKSIPMTPYVDPDLGTQLCYQSSKVIDAPIMTLHFDGGAQVPLLPTSTFIPPKEGVFCFAMAPTDGDVGILGNFAQSNHKIGFDLDNKVVSFLQADCTKE